MLCGRKNTRVYVQHQNLNILHCDFCGLYFQATHGSSQAPQDLYDNLYEEKPKSDQNKGYWDKRIKVHYDDIAAHQQEPGNLLDIGCSYGFLLEYFKARGWQVEGIDISENAVSYARSRGLNCHNVTIENYTCGKKYDAINMSNVLEHLQDPLGALIRIKNWLSSKGVLYIRVPNVESIVLPSRYQSFLGDMKPFEHLFYFSLNTLQALLQKAGFRATFKTDGRVNLGNTLNCYIRSKFVLKSSWQNLNYKTEAGFKKNYLILKHMYGEAMMLLGAIPIGPNNRELVAFAR
jgi:2-polyprenyl-3-methyl-5-hydroxy-6-metoxy-1,4-benzoquinol methylase